MDKIICKLPFNQISILPDGRFRLCCHCSSNGLYVKENGDEYSCLRGDKVDTVFVSKYIKKVREDMLKSTFPDPCENCFINGQIVKNSPLSENLMSDFDLKKYNQENLKIEMLDISLGNKCNLSCIMCNAIYSTGHQSKDGNSRLPMDENFLSGDFFSKCLHSLKIILIQGGEPLLSPLYIPLLKKLISEGVSKDIVIDHITNGTVAPTSEVIQLWDKFKKVDVSISIDGVSLVAEVIRQGLTWENFESKFNLFYKLHSQKIIELDTIMTFQVLNCNRVNEIFEFLKNYQEIIKVPRINILYHPSYLSVLSLSNNAKNKIIKSIDNVFTNEKNLLALEKKRISSLKENLLNHSHTGNNILLQESFIKLKLLENKLVRKNSNAQSVFKFAFELLRQSIDSI